MDLMLCGWVLYFGVILLNVVILMVFGLICCVYLFSCGCCMFL